MSSDDPTPDDLTPDDPRTQGGEGTPADAPQDGADRPRLTPPSDRMRPLIALAVEHVFDTLTRQDLFPPTVLAISEEGRRGMWALPALTPDDAAEAVAALRPRPVQAVAVFHGEVATPEGPRPAIAVESFEAGTVASVRLVQRYTPGVRATEQAAEAVGEAEVVENGPNPLT